MGTVDKRELTNFELQLLSTTLGYLKSVLEPLFPISYVSSILQYVITVSILLTLL